MPLLRRYLLQEAVNYEFYKDKLDTETFDKLVALDPTPNKVYGRWIVETFLRVFGPALKKIKNTQEKVDTDPNQKSTNYDVTINFDDGYYAAIRHIRRFWNEDTQKITNDLKDYDLLKRKNLLEPEDKNILNIKEYGLLWNLIHSKYENALSELEAKEADTRPSNAEKWYEDNQWLVVVPEDHAAACKYGANTRWCTTYRDDDSYFKQYSADGPLIIIINKEPLSPERQARMGKTSSDNRKWQIHIESDQWMDEENRDIGNKSDFVENLPKPVRAAIYEHTKNLMFHPDKINYVLKYLKSPNGFTVIQDWFAGQSFMVALNTQPDNEDNITDFIHKKLYYFAFSDLADDFAFSDLSDDKYDSDDYIYTFGYNHPWEFLKDQEPELKGEDEGYASDEDPEKWSEDQRRDAGEEAEAEAKDEALRDEAKQYNHLWNTRGYDSNFVEKIYDKVMSELFSMKYYREETEWTTMQLINLYAKDLSELGAALAKIDKARAGHKKFV